MIAAATEIFKNGSKLVPYQFGTRGCFFSRGCLKGPLFLQCYYWPLFYIIREYEQNPTLVPKWYAYQLGTNFIPLLKPPYHPDAVVEVSPTGLKFLRKDQRLTSTSKSAIYLKNKARIIKNRKGGFKLVLYSIKASINFNGPFWKILSKNKNKKIYRYRFLALT